jgi:hypothetical protein
MSRRTTAHALLAAALLMAGTPILAQDGGYPRISGSLSVEVENDDVYRSSPAGSTLNDLYTTTEPWLSLEFSQALSLNAGAVLEPVLDPEEDRVFEDHGIYLEQLYLQWSRNDWRLVGGKFNPSFGIGWDATPGLYGADFAEDYEITEQWGAAGAVDVADGGPFGALTLSLSLFMADRTALSDSAFTSRGRTRLADGGAGNTSWPRSLSLTVDGAEIPGMPGFGYHAGVMLRPGGKGDPGDERAAVLGLTHTITLGGGQEIELLVEGAYFSESGASLDDVSLLTAGAAWHRGGWNVAAAGALRDTRVNAGDNVGDQMFQISAGYAFDSGIALDVGWRFGDEDGVRTRTLGALASYSLDF